jgi:NADPH:quinone reductase-like Zn-dependent oxidoreductase
MNMRSFQVFECGAPLQMTEREAPKPEGTQVLLKILAAGVCHTDLHIWDGYYEIGDGKKLMLADRGLTLPLTMGHENVGEVVALGSDAEGVKVGDVRLVNPWMGCGQQGVPTRRRKPLPQPAVHRSALLPRGVCDPYAHASSAPSVRHRGPEARSGRATCLLRCHVLQRAEEGFCHPQG